MYHTNSEQDLRFLIGYNQRVFLIYGALSGSKLNGQTFSSLNFETSLFAYNYFLIAGLAACSNVNEVYLGITC